MHATSSSSSRACIGLPEMYNMPLTKGYFNGCLLTITSGPARGQSTRIVDYEYIGDISTATQTAPTLRPRSRQTEHAALPLPRDDVPQRFRPTARRTQPVPARPTLAVRATPPANCEIADLAGATFIVNGRPFNGTGVGFNELARAGEPRLNAREGVQLGTVTLRPGQPTADILHPEIALTPNAAYHFAVRPAQLERSRRSLGRPLPRSRHRRPDFMPLNPTSTATVAIAPSTRPLLWKYQTFAGPGDADESYDAPDFQNMALAMQTVSPRARGRVVQGNARQPDDARRRRSERRRSDQFLRLDLEDLPLPSFHRPDLINYLVPSAGPICGRSGRRHRPHHRRRGRAPCSRPTAPTASASNGDDDPGVDVEIRDQIVAIKRKISLRPLREDHPNFDGSNPASRPLDLDGVNDLVRNGNIAVPFWEAVGPWDVDNDNDGVPDSVWVDLGDPVAQAEDGTLYKPLYAFLIVDLDSRLNVNAHGLVEHLRRRLATIPNLDSTSAPGADRIPAISPTI